MKTFHSTLRKVSRVCLRVILGLNILIVYFLIALFCYIRLILYRLVFSKKRKLHSCGFLHPFASDGGGGERVLWHAICTILNSKYANFDEYVLYHASPLPSLCELEKRIKIQFGLSCKLTKPGAKKTLRLVASDSRDLLPNRFKILTLYRQAIASLCFMTDCLEKHGPDVLIDTFGVPFSYPLCNLMGIKVLCYVHYPYICSNNLGSAKKTSSLFINLIREEYLCCMRLFYQWMGSFVCKSVVNSSWTLDHMQLLWKQKRNHLDLLFPPVSDVNLSTSAGRRIYTIVSVSQFRREKNHRQQISIFHQLLKTKKDATFVIAGSVRNHDDQEYLAELREYACSLGISTQMKWMINLTNLERRQLLLNSLIGIHTMIDEHFGISLVEYMAAGCLCVAHASGGPLKDIISPAFNIENTCYDPNTPVDHAVGFLALDDQGFLRSITYILQMPEELRTAMRNRATFSIQRFSANSFAEGIERLIDPFTHIPMNSTALTWRENN